MYLTDQHKPQPFSAKTLNILSRTNSALEAISLASEQTERPILTTKFGVHSAVLVDLVTQVIPDIPVIWVDSGYNTNGTLAFVEELTEHFDLNLKAYKPETAWQNPIPESDAPEFSAFVDRVKLDPFKRAIADNQPDYWFTALRREQTETRASMNMFQESSHDLVKVCPLIDWRDEDMEAYIQFRGLPVGKESVDPTKVQPHLECGLHTRL